MTSSWSDPFGKIYRNDSAESRKKTLTDISLVPGQLVSRHMSVGRNLAPFAVFWLEPNFSSQTIFIKPDVVMMIIATDSISDPVNDWLLLLTSNDGYCWCPANTAILL